METVPSKRKLAFPRWHERQLFHSFAWFATCLLGGVVIATILEFVGLNTPGITPLITLVVRTLIRMNPLDRSRMCAAGHPGVIS